MKKCPSCPLLQKRHKQPAVDSDVIAEGKIHYPEEGRKMLELGAHAAIIGVLLQDHWKLQLYSLTLYAPVIMCV